MLQKDNLEELAAILVRKKQLRRNYNLEFIFPGLDDLDDEGRLTLRGANLFFLGSINDIYEKYETTWRFAERFIEKIAPDPDRLWHFIAKEHTLDEWMEKQGEYRLNRVAKLYRRNYRIANAILSEYGGDPRNIWCRDSSGELPTTSVVLDRLQGKVLMCGPHISRMMVGALKNAGILTGKSDLKADVHVTRVLGRIVKEGKITPDEALQLAREIYPEDPWEIDEPLFLLGKEICKAQNPNCILCYLRGMCEYRKSHHPEMGGPIDTMVDTTHEAKPPEDWELGIFKPEDIAEAGFFGGSEPLYEDEADYSMDSCIFCGAAEVYYMGGDNISIGKFLLCLECGDRLRETIDKAVRSECDEEREPWAEQAIYEKIRGYIDSGDVSGFKEVLEVIFSGMFCPQCGEKCTEHFAMEWECSFCGDNYRISS